jgi:hypothetical protein
VRTAAGTSWITAIRPGPAAPPRSNPYTRRATHRVHSATLKDRNATSVARIARFRSAALATCSEPLTPSFLKIDERQAYPQVYVNQG